MEYLDELDPIVTKMSDKEIEKDYFKYHTAERLLQLIVDTMIDINVHFIKEKELNVPDDLQGTFMILANNDILPEDFAQKIAPVVGMRNRIVHRYDTLEKSIFIEKLKKNYDDFKKYIILIQKFL